jgi:hypothetical protein
VGVVARTFDLDRPTVQRMLDRDALHRHDPRTPLTGRTAA